MTHNKNHMLAVIKLLDTMERARTHIRTLYVSSQVNTGFLRYHLQINVSARDIRHCTLFCAWNDAKLVDFRHCGDDDDDIFTRSSS